MDHIQCCHGCDEVIMKDSGYEIKIRSKVIVMKSGATFAVCKKCGVDNRIPLQLDQEMAKSLKSNPKLYISKKDTHQA